MSHSRNGSESPQLVRIKKKDYTLQRSNDRNQKHVAIAHSSKPEVARKEHFNGATPLIPNQTPTRPLDLANSSSFYQQTSSLYLPLSPISYNYPLQGICAEHLSPLILTYYPPFHGVVLSYSNARFSPDPTANIASEDSQPIYARSVDEYAASFVWVTADFLLFRPKRHDWVEGWVNLQNEGNLGLVCWNFFNASIERRKLPKEWIWVPERTLDQDGKSHRKKMRMSDAIADDGHYEDGRGRRIEGLIHFQVEDVETSRNLDRESGFMSIKGTLLKDNQEDELKQDLLAPTKLPIFEQRSKSAGNGEPENNDNSSES